MLHKLSNCHYSMNKIDIVYIPTTYYLIVFIGRYQNNNKIIIQILCLTNG